ncbi:MAG: DUF3365 domain-containing protein [Planctomycetaceae bacterium]|nr:DUF3365 domain-containing protein [Planctomycetaceae bacterium]
MVNSPGVVEVTFFSVFVAAMLGFGALICADEATGQQSESGSIEPSPVLKTEEARRQSKVLHSTIHSTLRVVHDRYYREDEALPIPAAAMGEIFKDIESIEHVKLRWLAVDGQAMNTDHVTKDSFETEAVKALKAGKLFHEEATERTNRRVASVTLSNHCLKCHIPDRQSTKDRTAGLIISVPIGR